MFWEGMGVGLIGGFITCIIACLWLMHGVADMNEEKATDR